MKHEAALIPIKPLINEYFLHSQSTVCTHMPIEVFS